MVERVEIEIGEQGTDHRALRGPVVGRPLRQSFEDRLVQKRVDEGEHPPVADLRLPPAPAAARAGWCRSTPAGPHPRRTGTPRAATRRRGAARLSRCVAAESRSCAGQSRVEDRFQHQSQGGLHDAVAHRRNPERAPLARAFRNPVPSDRLRTIRAVPQRLPTARRDSRRVAPQTSRPSHGPRPAPHDWPSPARRPRAACGSGVDLVNQRVPSSSSDALFERRQHPLRPHLRCRPRPAGADRPGRVSPRGHCCGGGLPTVRPSRIPLPAPLRSTPVTALRRYYERSDSCAGGSSARRAHEHRPFPRRSPCVLCHAVITIPSPPTRRAPLPLSHATPQPQPVPRVREVETSPVPGRLIAHVRPYRVRHPTDWSLSFGCSPPRLAVTQLPLDTGRRAYARRGLAPLCRGTIAGAPGAPAVRPSLIHPSAAS